MHIASHHKIDAGEPAIATQFPPLESVTRPTVNTAAAAYYLNRRPQTLRIYASRENGPLRPVRVHGRLHWKTDDLRHLLGVQTTAPSVPAGVAK